MGGEGGGRASAGAGSAVGRRRGRAAGGRLRLGSRVLGGYWEYQGFRLGFDTNVGSQSCLASPREHLLTVSCDMAAF